MESGGGGGVEERACIVLHVKGECKKLLNS